MGAINIHCFCGKREEVWIQAIFLLEVADVSKGGESIADSSISIVVPVHDNAETLARAIAPLTECEAVTELLLVPNGCTDGSDAMCREIASSVVKAKLVSSNVAGPSAARNAGIAQAASAYVTWLDADDWIDPGLLDVLVDAAQRHDCDFARADGIRVLPAGRERWSPVRATSGKPFAPGENKRYFNYILTGAGIYRRSFLDRIPLFPEDILLGEDRFFLWSSLLHAERIVHLRNCFYFYDLRGSNNLTSRSGLVHLDVMRSYERIWEELGDLIMRKKMLIQFRDQFIGAMAISYFRPGRLAEDEKKVWLDECRRYLTEMPRHDLERLFESGSASKREFLSRALCPG